MSSVRKNSAAAEFGVLVGTNGSIDNASSHTELSWDMHLHLHCICQGPRPSKLSRPQEHSWELGAARLLHWIT